MTAKPLVEDATEVEQRKEKVVGTFNLINHLDLLHGFLLLLRMLDFSSQYLLIDYISCFLGVE
jgi:hypothetical protein